MLQYFWRLKKKRVNLRGNHFIGGYTHNQCHPIRFLFVVHRLVRLLSLIYLCYDSLTFSQSTALFPPKRCRFSRHISTVDFANQRPRWVGQAPVRIGLGHGISVHQMDSWVRENFVIEIHADQQEVYTKILNLFVEIQGWIMLFHPRNTKSHCLWKKFGV